MTRRSTEQWAIPVLLAVLFFAAHLSHVDGATCSTDGSLVDCGYFGITKEECEKKQHCCYNSNVPPGSPWCFYPNGDYKYCSETAERSDCGYYGISEKECVERECCWHEKPGEPYCFFYNTNMDPRRCPTDKSREDCGYMGIQQDECERRDCCWSPLRHGSVGPWCYKPSDSGRGDAPKTPSDPAEVASPGYDTCCPASYRTDCGYMGIDEAQCLKRGCCWDPNEMDGVPWCYHNNCRDPSLKKCSAKRPRIECGNYKIKRSECESRGCCWSPLRKGSKDPWCFFKNGGKSRYDACCPRETRLECGFYGITKRECEQRDCCWGALSEHSDEPWCYRKNCVDPSQEICSEDDERIDCGYYGIQEKECEDRNCCWSPLGEASVDPWCFYKNAGEGKCCAADEGRINCGYVGIDEEECVSKGCCWSPLEEGSVEPWCFHKNSDDCGPAETEEKPPQPSEAETEEKPPQPSEAETEEKPPQPSEAETETEEKPPQPSEAETETEEKPPQPSEAETAESVEGTEEAASEQTEGLVSEEDIEEISQEYEVAVASETSSDEFDFGDVGVIREGSAESSVHQSGTSLAKSRKEEEETRESVGGASAAIVGEEGDILDEVVSSATTKKEEATEEETRHGGEREVRLGRHSGGVTKKVGSEKCLACESKEKAKESLEEQFVEGDEGTVDASKESATSSSTEIREVGAPSAKKDGASCGKYYCTLEGKKETEEESAGSHKAGSEKETESGSGESGGDSDHGAKSETTTAKHSTTSETVAEEGAEVVGEKEDVVEGSSEKVTKAGIGGASTESSAASKSETEKGAEVVGEETEDESGSAGGYSEHGGSHEHGYSSETTTTKETTTSIGTESKTVEKGSGEGKEVEEGSGTEEKAETKIVVSEVVEGVETGSVKEETEVESSTPGGGSSETTTEKHSTTRKTVIEEGVKVVGEKEDVVEGSSEKEEVESEAGDFSSETATAKHSTTSKTVIEEGTEVVGEKEDVVEGSTGKGSEFVKEESASVGKCEACGKGKPDSTSSLVSKSSHEEDEVESAGVKSKESEETASGAPEKTGSEVPGRGEKGDESSIGTETHTFTKTTVKEFYSGSEKEAVIRMMHCAVVKKEQCGEDNITEEECFESECCWHEGGDGNKSFCYKKGTWP